MMLFFMIYEVHSAILVVIKFMQVSNLVFLLSRYVSFMKRIHYDLFLYTICYLVYVLQNRSKINDSFLAARNINNHLLKSRTHSVESPNGRPPVEYMVLRVQVKFAHGLLKCGWL